jgi:hypothetical protein
MKTMLGLLALSAGILGTAQEADLSSEIRKLTEERDRLEKARRSLDDRFRILSARAAPGDAEVRSLLDRYRRMSVEDRFRWSSVPRSIIGVVQAVDAGEVRLNLGRAHGVEEGDLFAVRRGMETLGTFQVERLEEHRSWGRWPEGREAPRAGELALSATAAEGAAGADLSAFRRELDGLRFRVRELSDELLPTWKDPGFAAGEAGPELLNQLNVARALLVRRVRADSAAAAFGLRQYDVVPDRDEYELADDLRRGLALTVVRGGRPITLGK